MCTMLSHQYPRVRRYAAENLYILIQEMPELYDGTPQTNHPLLELLVTHPWDADQDHSQVMMIGGKVAEMLGIHVSCDN